MRNVVVGMELGGRLGFRFRRTDDMKRGREEIGGT